MIDPEIYEQIINDVLDSIQEMRESEDYDEDTLEGLEWRLKAPEGEQNGNYFCCIRCNTIASNYVCNRCQSVCKSCRNIQ